jgi:hypothetical protein|uniref:Uncharacterized protein n=1 Tax=viral metagenome TaxID=1070528 RepID=A0A6C0BGS7_9ZZZZ
MSIIVDSWSIFSNRPFQIEGVTRDGNHIFVREHCGHVRIEVNEKIIFQAYDVPDFWGFEELKEITQGHIVWSTESR